MKLKRYQVKVIGIYNFSDYYVSLKSLSSNISSVVLHLDICDPTGVTNLIKVHNITHVIHMTVQAGVRYSLTHTTGICGIEFRMFSIIIRSDQVKEYQINICVVFIVYSENTEIPFSESHRILIRSNQTRRRTDGACVPQNVMTFIETIERFMGKKVILNCVEMAKGEVLTTYADILKAQRAID